MAGKPRCGARARVRPKRTKLHLGLDRILRKKDTTRGQIKACVPRYGPKDENGQDALLMTTRMRGIVGEECDGCRATFRQPTRREVQRLDYGESRQEILSLY